VKKITAQNRWARPTCCNLNCHQPVTYSHKSAAGVPRWRPVCSRCQRASYGGGELAKGVVPIKRDHCENVDGRLGYVCSAHIPYPGALELDHRNGDRLDNVPDNIQTLCKVCHSYKSHISRDFDKTHTKRG